MFYDLGINGTFYTLGIPTITLSAVVLFSICPPLIAFSQLVPDFEERNLTPAMAFSQITPVLESEGVSPTAGFSDVIPDIYVGSCSNV